MLSFQKFHLMCITNVQLAELQLAITNKLDIKNTFLVDSLQRIVSMFK